MVKSWKEAQKLGQRRGSRCGDQAEQGVPRGRGRVGMFLSLLCIETLQALALLLGYSQNSWHQPQEFHCKLTSSHTIMDLFPI